MAPYYVDDCVTLFHGDCRDVLPTLGTGFDLLLTDPPYGIHTVKPTSGFLSKRGDGTAQEAIAWDRRPDAETLRLALASSSHAIVWGFGYLASILGDCRAPLVWDKQTGANYFADGELAWTSFERGTLRIFRHQWCGSWRASERGEAARHPTQKPIALMSWCLGLVESVETVIDPFAGVGTTLVAAKRIGIRAIGIEAREDYCEAAVDRLRQGSLVGMF